MQTRENIKEFILKLENEFPVDQWKVNQIHIWPIIRIRLYFNVLFQVEKSYQHKLIEQTKENNPSKNKIANNWRVKKLKAFMALLKIKKADFLFSEAITHRANYKGELWSKLFDPILNNLNRKGVFIEHSPKIKYKGSKLHNTKNVYFLNDIANYVYYNKSRAVNHKKVTKDIDLERYNDFIDFLNKNDITKDFAKKHDISSLINIMKKFADLCTMYALILDKVKPKIIFSACFYTFQVMALNYVANKKGIKTIEVQHGPQSSVHMGYAEWTKIPEMGFNTMPQFFWCWDKNSSETLKKWTNKSNQKVITGGNPWVDFFNYKIKKPTHKVALYSLQNLNLEYMFRDEIVNLINNNSEYQFWIRLHPIQIEFKEQLKEILAQKNLLNKVNIDDATALPLPEVLSKTAIHLTHFSGCTIESSFFNIPTVLLDKRGIETFPELINEKKAIFIENFNIKLSELSNFFNFEYTNVQKTNYNEIIDFILSH
ncbi:MAG: hypothetical protein Kow0079_07290 [Vicingaceae bacterium]